MRAVETREEMIQQDKLTYLSSASDQKKPMAALKKEELFESMLTRRSRVVEGCGKKKMEVGFLMEWKSRIKTS